MACLLRFCFVTTSPLVTSALLVLMNGCTSSMFHDTKTEVHKLMSQLSSLLEELTTCVTLWLLFTLWKIVTLFLVEGDSMTKTAWMRGAYPLAHQCSLKSTHFFKALFPNVHTIVYVVSSICKQCLLQVFSFFFPEKATKTVTKWKPPKGFQYQSTRND